jgi:hypothetical protein
MTTYPQRHFSILTIFLILLSTLLAACAPQVVPAVDRGPRDDCGYIEPSQEDLNKVLAFGADLFKSDDWVKSYSVEPYKVTVTHHNDAAFAVAYTEYLIYTCGYGQTEMDEYFNDEGFAIVFDGYESYNLAKFCEVESLALYKFNAIDEGAEYDVNYWVEQSDDNHVLVMMLVFPKGNTAVLDEYSKRLFPNLTTCS